MLDVYIDSHAIRIGPRFAVVFQRTLRLPDDGRTYPLPPGLGAFPIFKVADYAERVPPKWREHGGVFIPMYQREALWLGFRAAAWKPNAVKIAVGRVNTISGEPYDHTLRTAPQDYVVCPEQLWLDGLNTGSSTIRQFVAMPLGLGYTVEAAMTGTETYGGLQITVFEPKPGHFPDTPPPQAETGPVSFAKLQFSTSSRRSHDQQMGLGAGGLMKQKIYPDSYGVDVWDADNRGEVTVHIVNSAECFEITQKEPPGSPIRAQTYTDWGLPWFDLYDEARGDLAPPQRLTEIHTIADRDTELGHSPADETSVDIPETQIKILGKKR